MRFKGAFPFYWAWQGRNAAEFLIVGLYLFVRRGYPRGGFRLCPRYGTMALDVCWGMAGCLFGQRGMAKILLVEDESNLLIMTQMMMRRAGHEADGVSSGNEALERIRDRAHFDYDVVLTDYRLGDVTGLDVLRAVKERDASVQVLLVTAYATTATAVEAMRCGAFDYIEKPFKRDELLALVDKASARRQALKLSSVQDFEKKAFVASSPAMRDVASLVARVAPTKANILITGESGTGKEVVARAIHRLSGLKGAFVAVNCGAIPETLLESEFFGYVRGAFTGANRDKPGYFQAAAHGSLFLDEIGELPLPMQVKLLRAIQEKRVQPVGSTVEDDVSVRIIAATNLDLRAEVEARRFREDLFFRLNVIQIGLPPLRDRKDDIPLMIDYFIRKFNKELEKNIIGVSESVREILMNYPYRGNVRELENILEHAVTLEASERITLGALPAYLRNEHGMAWGGKGHAMPAMPGDVGEVAGHAHVEERPDIGDGVALDGIVEDLERSYIEQSLEQSHGNKTEAAKLLGISFRSLRYRLKKYGMGGE